MSWRVGVLVGALVLSGCGGVDEPEAAAPDVPSPSPAQTITHHPIGRDLYMLAFADGKLWATHPGGVLAFDPDAVEPVVELEVGEGPEFVVAADGRLWTTEFDGELLHEVDTTNGVLLEGHPVKAGSDGVTYANGHVWVSNHHDSSVQRIDPVTREVVADITVGDGVTVRGGPASSAAGFGSVWVGVPYRRAVVRIDVATNTVVAEIPVADCTACGAIAITGEDTPTAEDDGVWVTGDARVTRIDPAQNRSLSELDLGWPSSDQAWDGGLVYAEGSLWATTRRATLARIDPMSGQVVSETEVGDEAAGSRGGSVTHGDGVLWVYDYGRRTLVRIPIAALATDRAAP